MASKMRWGIISTGKIAAQFAKGLKLLADAELVAVGSRTQQAAEAFGERFNIPRRYGNYEELVNDPNVDIVYIGTPHNLHHENCLLSLGAGKAVLCEKSFAVNAHQAEEMIALAREKRLFLMDAIWSRFTPVYDKIREVLAEGKLGDIRLVTADFGFKPVFDPKDRLFDPALAGGALLDIGVYPVMLASMVFGEPKTIASHAEFGQTGVDEQDGIVFGYDGGRMAVLDATFQAETSQEAQIIGREGRLRIHRQFWHAQAMTLSLPGLSDQVIEPPYEGNGYNYEAAEVIRCLREGQTESPLMPLDETLAIMRTLDAIRAQWGFKYPFE